MGISDENGSQCPFPAVIHSLGFAEGTTVQGTAVEGRWFDPS